MFQANNGVSVSRDLAMVMEERQIELRGLKKKKKERKGNDLFLHCDQAAPVSVMTRTLFGWLFSHFRGGDCGLW